MGRRRYYNPAFYGPEEVDLMRRFWLQKEDARVYFTNYLRPRFDRSYKLYTAWNGDRAREIKRWQANVAVPYVQAVVETLMPRVIDARPDFTVQGRNESDQMKAEKNQQLLDYTWEKAEMDKTSEMVVRSSLVYGTGFLQVSWKKDVRKQKFLSTKDLLDKKYVWKEKEQTFYDAPYAECVDPYGLWYDWHNVARESKQFWFKRMVLTGQEIARRYPMADPERMEMAFYGGTQDLTDYASIRNEIKTTHWMTTKGADYYAQTQTSGVTNTRYQQTDDPMLRMQEVFEWWRPFDDAYAVMVNTVPILRGAVMPIPYDFKEATFIDFPYLKLPFEFEGLGLPMMLENPQVMLNMVKNQRLDAMTLGIHKMWIVNPLANIDQKELVTRPFGIIHSTDPNGAREIQQSDIKPSAYREEELLKGDMRYASGVDDFSMGVGGGASSATEVRHLRESTLERVRLFVNHLGDGYSLLMRWWMDMYRQFMSKAMTIRVIGEEGAEMYPLIEPDDLKGEFDFKASVIPSIAGKNDIDKKQSMDLFQLLAPMSFVDTRKLTSKVLHSWNWTLDSISKEEQPQPGMEGMPGAEGMSPGMDGAAPGGMPPEMMPGGAPGGAPGGMPVPSGGAVPDSVIQGALALLGGGQGAQPSPFAQAGMPINLLQSGGMPPTAPGIPVGKTSNPRGMNRGGKVNTNIPTKPSPAEGNLLNQAANIQR